MYFKCPSCPSMISKIKVNSSNPAFIEAEGKLPLSSRSLDLLVRVHVSKQEMFVSMGLRASVC